MIKELDTVKTLMSLKQEDIEWDISSDQLVLKNLPSSTMRATLDEHNIPLQQNMEKAKKKKKIKRIDNVWDIFEDQRQKSAGPVVQHIQYRPQKSESQKLHHWKLKLIYSAALGWEGHSSFSVFHKLFFIHPA